ncbi:hypothetical protein [Nocardia brevicatena]|uniref:hypothetical protein n=1 Tax=Nocardia brevicatena TaxID=37327 RepID=UPI0002D48D23|nr:hypothetical protein [Nocardia brevicatena]
MCTYGRPKTLDFEPPKSVWLVELGPTGLVSATACPLTVPTTTIRVAGTVIELTAHAVSFDYVHATLTDPDRPVGAWWKLRRRFAHLIQVEWIDPATGEVKAIPLDHDAPEPAALPTPPTGEGSEHGFYGEGNQQCLRCGTAPGQPCFRTRTAHGVEYNNGITPDADSPARNWPNSDGSPTSSSTTTVTTSNCGSTPTDTTRR